MDPRPAGHSRPEIKSPAFCRSAVRGFARHPGPRADNAHVALEDIEQLRDLVQSPFAQPAPDRRDAIIVLGYSRPIPDRFSSDHHRAEFVTTKLLPIPSHTILHEQDRAAIIQLDRQRNQSDERREQKQSAGSDDKIKESFLGETTIGISDFGFRIADLPA